MTDPRAGTDERARTDEGRLAALVAPLALGHFLDAYYQQKPAVLRGSSARGAGLVDHQTIVEAIAREAAPPGNLFVSKDHLDAEATPTPAFASRYATRVDEGTEPLWAYLEAGHPIVWNAARGLSPALDELTASLSRALSAHVWPNVYATGTAGTPLDIHFDTHEVLALQCEGEKTWTISAVRINRPLDRPELRPTVVHALESRRDEALAETAMTFDVHPGDVVYVPRGQFHNARTARDRSLHVTFGIEPLSGMDLMDALGRLAVQDSAFREYFPLAIADPDGTRRAHHLDDLRSRIGTLAGSDALLASLDEVLALRLARSPTR